MIRSDLEFLIHSFIDENLFPWLDPSLHERYLILRYVSSFNSYLSRQLTTHDVDINQLFTIEALNDEADLIADRNLTTGEIIGLEEVIFTERDSFDR